MSAVITSKATQRKLEKRGQRRSVPIPKWPAALMPLVQSREGRAALREVLLYEKWEKGGCEGPDPCPRPEELKVDPAMSERATAAYARRGKPALV